MAETVLTVGRGHKRRHIKQARLVVRRTRLTDTAQRRLWPDWRHHAFITSNTEVSPVEADQFHRQHAAVGKHSG